MTKTQKNPIKPSLFLLLTTGTKALGALILGLYSIGFGFYGVNVFGAIDYLIPAERAMLLAIGVVVMILAVVNTISFVQMYWRIIKK